VILGEFTDCEANLDFGSVEEMLVSYLKDYGILVCCGFPGGHGDVNLPLLMGAPVTLEVTPEGSKLTFDIDGNQEVVNAETVPLTDSLSTVKPLDLVGDKHYKVVRIYNFIKHYRGVRY
jgi:muramoyltetrapeptide carboxypeptidase